MENLKPFDLVDAHAKLVAIEIVIRNICRAIPAAQSQLTLDLLDQFRDDIYSKDPLSELENSLWEKVFAHVRTFEADLAAGPATYCAAS